VQSNRPVTLSHDTVTTRYLAEHHDSNRFLLVPQEIVVSKVLNILENRKAKLSQSQVYRPISLNLLHHHWQKLVHTITWIVRRLSCTSQPGLFTSMLSYWKILCPGLTWFVRNLILIPCHSFLWPWFFFPLRFNRTSSRDWLLFGDPAYLHTGLWQRCLALWVNAMS
jgi:hypothetical protein